MMQGRSDDAGAVTRTVLSGHRALSTMHGHVQFSFEQRRCACVVRSAFPDCVAALQQTHLTSTTAVGCVDAFRHHPRLRIWPRVTAKDIYTSFFPSSIRALPSLRPRRASMYSEVEASRSTGMLCSLLLP